MKVFRSILILVVGALIGFELGRTYEYHYGIHDIELRIVPPTSGQGDKSPRTIPDMEPEPLPEAKDLFQFDAKQPKEVPLKASPLLY